jgi:HK97 family phage prohead protease
MSKEKEVVIRSLPAAFETREENGMGIIEGRPVVLNSVTDLGFCDEVIDSRALTGTDLTDVRLCLNHVTDYVYARSRQNNGNSTMQLFVDEAGLRFVASLNIESSPKAQDYYSAVKRGDMDKMSFMFSIDGYEWENLESDHPTRRITKIGTIYEISAVTFPAYNSTSIEARDASVLESIRRELESARAKRFKSPDGDLALERAKFDFKMKFGGK